MSITRTSFFGKLKYADPINPNLSSPIESKDLYKILNGNLKSNFNLYINLLSKLLVIADKSMPLTSDITIASINFI